MVEGESGLLAIGPPQQRPQYEPTKRRLTWPNGAIATTYSADEPERLRGPQHDAAWCDEIASRPQDAAQAFRRGDRDRADQGHGWVAQSLFKEATKGEDPRSRVSAAIFWLCRRAGWKETKITEHIGKDGAAIDVRHSIELKLDRLHQTLTRREASDTPEGTDSEEL